MRRGEKTDANQQAIVAGLCAVGCKVAITSGAGDGFPDLVVGSPFTGRVYPIEVKDGTLTPSKRALTPKQKKFHQEFAGYCWLANSLDGALLIVGAKTT